MSRSLGRGLDVFESVKLADTGGYGADAGAKAVMELEP